MQWLTEEEGQTSELGALLPVMSWDLIQVVRHGGVFTQEASTKAQGQSILFSVSVR